MTADPYRYIRDWHDRRGQIGWWHSFELPGGELLAGVNTLDSQKARIAQFPIPQDLRGARALDIGTWDGWFAMELERRGADVVAIDHWDNPRLRQIHEILGSRVDYRQLNVYDLDPASLGRFDVVLFMGVLYHLRHPLLALERVASVATGLVAVESFVLRDRHRPGCGVEDLPLLEFFEGEDFGGQLDNWFAPTVPTLMGLCRTAGFVQVELARVSEYGAAVTCDRRWPALPPEAEQETDKVRLIAVYENDSRGVNFRADGSDLYVACRLACGGVELSMGSVWPEVSGIPSAPVFAGRVENDQWQVNFHLPPGLSPGWHEVRVRTPAGCSNALRIAVDLPCTAERLEIRGVADSATWEKYRMATGESVSLWVSGLPGNADLDTVRVWLSGKLMLTTFVGEADADGVRQVNARPITQAKIGANELVASVGDTRSDAVAIQVDELRYLVPTPAFEIQ